MKFTVSLSRVAICTPKMKAAFIGCADLVEQTGAVKFNGWTTEDHDGVAFVAASFDHETSHDFEGTEQFLRGIAYAVTQLVTG